MIALMILIYLVGAVLGMGNNLLSASWPVLSTFLGAPVSGAGIWSAILTGSMLAASLTAAALNRRFGTGRVVTAMLVLSGASILITSFVTGFPVLCALAVPMGYAGGCITTIHSRYVAMHYRAAFSSLMNALTGIGCAFGPMLMSVFLANGENWQGGYLTVGGLQLALVIALLFVWSCWKDEGRIPEGAASGGQKAFGNLETLRCPGMVTAMLTMFAFYSIVNIVGLWAATYMSEAKHLSAEVAARYSSIYFVGATGGCMLSSALSFRMKCRGIMRLAYMIGALGILALMLPLSGVFTGAGLFLIGLGISPLFPNLIRLTPCRFGAERAQAAIGLEMAAAYLGNAVMPLAFGAFAEVFGFETMPFVLMGLLVLTVVFAERNNRRFHVAEEE